MENVEFMIQTYTNLMVWGGIAGFLIYLFMSAIAEGISKVVHLIDIK